jgi:hypothetical protein
MYNGIPIKDFHGDKNDEVLKNLTTYLMSFKDEHDVTVKIQKDFNMLKLYE